MTTLDTKDRLRQSREEIALRRHRLRQGGFRTRHAAEVRSVMSITAGRIQFRLQVFGTMVEVGNRCGVRERISRKRQLSCAPLTVVTSFATALSERSDLIHH